RRKPYAVILFDEVEKAHPDVFNVLLQILDDGRVTDSKGRTVDFKNTIIILTSNLGSQFILDGIDAHGEISEEAEKAVNDMLKTHFRPEFLNRLDEIVIYKPLQKSEIVQIVSLLEKDLEKRLEDKQLHVRLTERAKDYVADQGFDPIFGARPLRRFLQRKVETLIARTLIAKEITPFSTFIVDYDGQSLTVSVEEA
ncbi:MAG: AAA family ATPase, partial [Cellulosilyticum sp.]|nr:AAA family ATPase [Cellulosilyticum sp.]